MAKKLSNMSKEELEGIRENEQAMIQNATAIFRRAGVFLDAARQGQSAADLKAEAAALIAKAEKLEDSDG